MNEEKPVRYSVNYQFLPKGATRPEDWGWAYAIEVDSTEGMLLMPSVGDYVQAVPLGQSTNAARFSGRVRSRLFVMNSLEEGFTDSIGVNIVIEETDGDEWPLLIKE